MKRCWFGGAALLVLLAVSLVLSMAMGSFWEELSLETARAAELPQEKAAEAVAQVHDRWNSRRTLAAMLCDHASLDAVEENFRAVGPDSENYRELCRRLAAQLHALAQSQKLTPENIF